MKTDRVKHPTIRTPIATEALRLESSEGLRDAQRDTEALRATQTIVLVFDQLRCNARDL